MSYADDAITTRIRQTPKPYRVWVPAGVYRNLGPYPRSWLMAREVPQLFGYHGNEIRFFDELLGGKEDWRQQVNPHILGLYAIRYVVLAQQQDVPGFHQILGPVPITPGGTAYLYEADSTPSYARVVGGAVKAPDDQIPGAVVDPRFAWDRVVLYPDTASVSPEPLGGTVPEASPVRAEVTEWQAGRMRIALTGSAPKPQYLVVSENWYRDWQARVDGTPAPVLRGQYALLSIVLPPGAKEVLLEFRSKAYRRGRLVSLVSLIGVAGLFAVPIVQRRRRRNA